MCHQSFKGPWGCCIPTTVQQLSHPAGFQLTPSVLIFFSKLSLMAFFKLPLTADVLCLCHCQVPAVLPWAVPGRAWLCWNTQGWDQGSSPPYPPGHKVQESMTNFTFKGRSQKGEKNIKKTPNLKKKPLWGGYDQDLTAITNLRNLPAYPSWNNLLFFVKKAKKDPCTHFAGLSPKTA